MSALWTEGSIEEKLAAAFSMAVVLQRTRSGAPSRLVKPVPVAPPRVLKKVRAWELRALKASR
jgi:hypothetical protein